MEESSPPATDEILIISSSQRQVIEDCSLVLSAKNIRHRINQLGTDNIEIRVPSDFSESARYQIESFFRENRNWPPPKVLPEKGAFSAILPTLLVAGSMAWFYAITGPWSHHSSWFAAGANNAEAVIMGGEWYRVITALTLHADLSHLAGNCLIGAFLIYFFIQINGPGLGILAILAAGGTGNWINDVLHGTGHLSVGFSTAVFSLVGMLSMYRIIEQKQPPGIRMFVPFMAGIALLAMLGSSGPRTDLGAHLFGLGTGLVIGAGLASSFVRSIRSSSFLQVCCLLLGIIILIFSWQQALTKGNYQL